LEEALKEEQIRVLNEHIKEYAAGSYEVREKIVEDFLGRFQRAHPKGVKFDGKAVETVRAVSAVSGCSHTFYSLFASTCMEKRRL
jgi:hypothetical protein